MAYQTSTWQRIRKPAAVQSGDTLSITTAYQAFASTVPIPASAWRAGRSFRFRCRGIVTVGLGLNLTAALYLNAVKIAETPGVGLGLLTSAAWRGDLEIDVLAAGASGVLEVQGEALFGVTAGNGVNSAFANTSTFAVDLSADQVLSLQVKGSLLNAGNTIQLRKVLAEATMVQ